MRTITRTTTRVQHFVTLPEIDALEPVLDVEREHEAAERYALGLLDLPHMGAHSPAQVEDFSGILDGEPDSVEYALDREPMYLPLPSMEHLAPCDLEDALIEGYVRGEQEDYLAFLAENPDHTLRRTLMSSVLHGDMTVWEADRFYVVVSPTLGEEYLEALEPDTIEDAMYDEDNLYMSLDYIAREGTLQALDNHDMWIEHTQ